MPTKLPRVTANLPEDVFRDLKRRSQKEKKSLSRLIIIAIIAFLAGGCSKSDKSQSAQEPSPLPGQGVTVCPHFCVQNGPCGC